MASLGSMNRMVNIDTRCWIRQLIKIADVVECIWRSNQFGRGFLLFLKLLLDVLYALYLLYIFTLMGKIKAAL